MKRAKCGKAWRRIGFPVRLKLMTRRRAARTARPSRARTTPPLSREEALAAYEASGYDLPTHPAHMIRRAHQRATFYFQQVMNGEELTPTQQAALATLLKHGELSQNHLGRLTAMDPSTISIVVRKLLKNGFIERRGSKKDQRLAMIRLTDEGVRYAIDRLADSMEVGPPRARAALAGRAADADRSPPPDRRRRRRFRLKAEPSELSPTKRIRACPMTPPKATARRPSSSSAISASCFQARSSVRSSMRIRSWPRTAGSAAIGREKDLDTDGATTLVDAKGSALVARPDRQPCPPGRRRLDAAAEPDRLDRFLPAWRRHHDDLGRRGAHAGPTDATSSASRRSRSPRSEPSPPSARPASRCMPARR